MTERMLMMDSRGYTHLLVGPDYAAFPVWDRSPRHMPGMVQPEYLSLSQELVDALYDWNGDWEDETPVAALDEFDWETRGRNLTLRLQRELGSHVIVAYYTDGIDAPPFDRVGFGKAHRIDPSKFDGGSGFTPL